MTHLRTEKAKPSANLGSPTAAQYGYLAIGIIALSFAAIFVRLSDVAPPVIAFYRLAFAWVPLFLVINLPRMRKTAVRSGGFASRSDFYLAAAAGACLGLHYAVWFVSLQYTSIGSSTTLVTLQPIFVVLFSFLLFKERVSGKSILGLVLAILGAFVITSSDAMFSRDHLYGDMLALGAAVLIAIYLMIGRSVRHRVDTFHYMNVVYASGALVLLILNLSTGQEMSGFALREWLIFIGLAVVSTLLGHTLLNWLLGSLRASTVSIFFLGEPVGANILAYLLMNEMMGVRQTLGAALVLLGIAFFLLGSNPRK